MKSCQYSPHEVGNKIPVLILAATVITTLVHILLPPAHSSQSSSYIMGNSQKVGKRV